MLIFYSVVGSLHILVSIQFVWKFCQTESGDFDDFERSEVQGNIMEVERLVNRSSNNHMRVLEN